MPTYEYRCGACGHEFEKFQKMSADPVKECPECGEPEVVRLISPGAGIVFKGSGFYATDYRDPPPSKEGDGSGGKESGGEKEARAADGGGSTGEGSPGGGKGSGAEKTGTADD